MESFIPFWYGNNNTGRKERGKMKKFYVSYWENLKKKEMTIEAQGREMAKRKFRELKENTNVSVIQVREII